MVEGVPIQIQENMATPQYDLSTITTGEEFVATLSRELTKLDIDTLVEIVNDAVDWVNFDPNQYGFQLPNQLSIKGWNIKNKEEKVDLPNGLSVRRSFAANAAIELWMRRLQQATNIDRSESSLGRSNRINSPKKLAQLQNVEEMANALFHEPIINRDILIYQIERKIQKQKSTYKKGDDRPMLEELFFNKGYLTQEKISHLNADQERIDSLLQIIREVLTSPDVATKIDASIGRLKLEGLHAINIDRYGGAIAEAWEENMGTFAALNKTFDQEDIPTSGNSQ